MDSSNKNNAARDIDANDLLIRAFTFARVLRTTPELFKAMQAYGFSAEALTEGWKLLYRVTRLDQEAAIPSTLNVGSALRDLDAWDESGFERVHIALRRQFPTQEAFLFRNLEAVRGPQAVVGVQVFLDRLAELESSPARESTRTEDLAAVAVLAKRGIDAGERARLRALVDIAMSGPNPDELLDAVIAPNAEDLAALAAWYQDWSETAQLAFKRRDILFRLGIVKRRRPRSTKSETAPVVPVTTTAPLAPSSPAPVVNGSNGSTPNPNLGNVIPGGIA